MDTAAQVTTMPESAVSKIPNAHNHRDAPPGTAVKYGNDELETIERLDDIGHYESQVIPDNCAVTLISVDQIVEDGHTVTFSRTQTIIHDDEGRYRLQYDRAPDSREWTMPVEAMEDITILRQNYHCLAWTLDNYRKNTGTRNRRAHHGSFSVTCAAAACMSAPPSEGAMYFAYISA